MSDYPQNPWSSQSKSYAHDYSGYHQQQEQDHQDYRQHQGGAIADTAREAQQYPYEYPYEYAPYTADDAPYTPSQPAVEAGAGAATTATGHQDYLTGGATSTAATSFAQYASRPPEQQQVHQQHPHSQYPDAYDPLNRTSQGSSSVANHYWLPAPQQQNPIPDPTAALVQTYPSSSSAWSGEPASGLGFEFSGIPDSLKLPLLSPQVAVENNSNQFPDNNYYQQQFQASRSTTSYNTAIASPAQSAASGFAGPQASTLYNVDSVRRRSPSPSSISATARLVTFLQDQQQQKERDWAIFQEDWQALLLANERALEQQIGYIPARNMSLPAPTYDDCETLGYGLRNVTVDMLKSIIRGINTSGSGPLNHIYVTGNKQVLIDRIVDVMRSLKNTRNDSYVRVAKLVGEAQGLRYATDDTAVARQPTAGAAPAIAAGATVSAPGTSYTRQDYPYGNYNASAPVASTSGTADYASRPTDFGLSRSPSRAVAGHSGAAGTYGNHAGPSTGTNMYNQGGYNNSPNLYNRAIPPPPAPRASTSNTTAAPRNNPLNGQIPTSWPRPLPPAPKSSIPGQPAIPMNFKPSPFFKIISAVSPVVSLPRPHGNERAIATAQVTLTEEQRQKLQASRDDPKAAQYQLRLYCASSDFYYPHTATYGNIARAALPIEFPLSSEAKMNETAVTASLRGIKKKPGTAPPAPVSNAKIGTPSRTSTSTPTGPVGSYALKLSPPNASNKVELVYMNTEKTYYMIVYFVETFSVEQVVEKIKKEKFRQKEDVLKSIHRAAEDPDIQATSSTISMKDPVAYTKINVPIRSINCVHLQCYDAFVFLSMMDTTPDWKCPVCNRAITSDELVHDGFFQEIQDEIKNSSSVETVIVEVDGTWRTEDNKFGNAKKALAYREALKNGTANTIGSIDLAGSSRASSLSSLPAKDGTPLDIKPDLNASSGGLAVPNGANGRGGSKSKTPAAVIELDDDDDDLDSLNDLNTPPPPARPPLSGRPSQTGSFPSLSNTATGAGGTRPGATTRGAATAGRVIDLTLSDSDDEAGSSIVGMGSRATSSVILSRTPGRTNGNTSTANGTAAEGSGNVVAGVKRRLDSEAAYEDIWGQDGNGGDAQDAYRDFIGGRQNDGLDTRPSQIPRYN